ncbi:hypothetical protein BDW74DRAFT_179830 [Aspergillus multicolor]|uniref:uncharacterized protein n=1 Tax=Aspergillus multicolor TaxID=41759 RepID=UPI003CCDB694
MHFSPSLLTLTTLALSLSSATTTPLNPHLPSITSPSINKPSPNTHLSSLTLPNPTLKPEHATASQSIIHAIATLLATDASASLDPTTCPPSHPSKQCCTSVSGLADYVIGEKALGGVLPWVKGVKVSSLVGVQCKPMSENQANIDCLDTVMCCAGGAGGKQANADSLLKSECVPFDEAIEDKKKAIGKSKAEASYLAAAASSSVAGATPTAAAAASSQPSGV